MEEVEDSYIQFKNHQRILPRLEPSQAFSRRNASSNLSTNPMLQGIHVGMLKFWHTDDCVQELKRLEFHPGFPFGNKVRCPAFTGDKIFYLLGAPLHTLPSFMVELNQSEAYYAQMYPRADR